MADFKAWRHESLVVFAEQATVEIADKTARITELEQDLKVAINAYRVLVRTGANYADTREPDKEGNQKNTG